MDQPDIASVRSLDGAVPQTPAPRTYSVRFGKRGAFATHVPDSLRLLGRGEVRIDDAGVVIAGKRYRAFGIGRRVVHAFDRERLMNVARDDGTVRFDVVTADGTRQIVQFHADDAIDAASIVRSLPDTRTTAFVAERADLSEFHQRLDEFSPRIWVTPAIVALNVAIFVAMCVAGIDLFEPDGQGLIGWGSNYGPLTRDGQWWRLVSSNWLHFGLLHLVFNMLALWQSGPTIERLLGSRRFLGLYAFAGLTGSMTSLLWHSDVNSAGASGAIFGAFGALLAFVIIPRNGVPAAVMQEHRTSTLAFVAFALVNGFSSARTDNAAHIGGLVGGFVMGLLLARPLDAASRQQESAGIGSAAALGCVLVALLAAPILHPSQGARDAMQFRSALRAAQAQDKAAVEASNALAVRVRNGSLKGPAFVDAVRTDVLPKWGALYAGISTPALAPTAKDYELQQALMAYAAGRRKAFELFAQAEASGDATLAKQGQAAHQDADAAMERMNRIVSIQK